MGLLFSQHKTKGYPSTHIDAYSALDNPKFILLEEDFFRKNEQEDLRHVSEGYVAKSSTLQSV